MAVAAENAMAQVAVARDHAHKVARKMEADLRKVLAQADRDQVAHAQPALVQAVRALAARVPQAAHKAADVPRVVRRHANR